MKTRRGGMSVLAMVVACGAALAVVIPAQPVEAGHKPRNDCGPSYPSRSHSYDRHSSRSRVGISLHIGTGGYSKYRGSYYSGYSNKEKVPTYYSYSYPRYQYRGYTPAYRYECYDTPRVNTYYNNYSYNTYTYPTPPAGTATYRVWQQDLATPVGQAEPVYPSYNPGPGVALSSGAPGAIGTRRNGRPLTSGSSSVSCSRASRRRTGLRRSQSGRAHRSALQRRSRPGG
ncbi:MAG: hypothetical protein R3B46_02645 [Phycisphaerales bacterium]